MGCKLEVENKVQVMMFKYPGIEISERNPNRETANLVPKIGKTSGALRKVMWKIKYPNVRQVFIRPAFVRFSRVPSRPELTRPGRTTRRRSRKSVTRKAQTILCHVRRRKGGRRLISL